MTKSVVVKVNGKTELGTDFEMRYLIFGKNDFEAIKDAVDYANDEYNVLRDENGNIIREYKECVEITGIELIERMGDA